MGQLPASINMASGTALCQADLQSFLNGQLSDFFSDKSIQ